MTKTPAIKRKQKKQVVLSPERNIRYEAVIIIEAAVLVLSAAVFICWLPVYFINVRMPLALIVVDTAIASLLVQGLILLKQSRRTDQYQQRIAALAMTVVYPLVQFIVLALLYISQVGPFSSAFREAAHTALGAILAFNGSLPVILLMVVCTTIGSLWLWKIIAMTKEAPYWQPRSADQLSEAEKIKQERGLRYRNIGLTLMVHGAGAACTHRCVRACRDAFVYCSYYHSLCYNASDVCGSAICSYSELCRRAGVYDEK